VDHLEIRFRILLLLYNKFFGGEYHEWQKVEKVIEEAELLNLDNRYDVYGDIVYLKDSNFIHDLGMWPNGHSFPPFIRITENGIRYVEDNFNNLIQGINESDIDMGSKNELTSELSKQNSIVGKIKMFSEYIKLHPGLVVSLSLLLIRNGVAVGRSIRKYAISESKLLDSIGSAQMEQQIQKNCLLILH